MSRAKGALNKHVNPETLERREALKATAERRHRTIALANGYMTRTGMTASDFAHRVGCGNSTLRKFLADRYEYVASSDSLITQKVLAFLERYPVESADEPTKKLYEIGNVKAFRDVFTRALDRPHIFMVYAPPGSGKTDVARTLMAQHNLAGAAADDGRKQHIFMVYCRLGIRPRDLMARVAHACGASSAGEIERILRNIQWECRGQRVALVFDEAQHLSVECMETVRELFDLAPKMSLIFTGSHALDDIFRKFRGTLEQLERRVTERITLPPVSREEAAGIVRSELGALLPDLDDSRIQEQIEMATVEIATKKGDRKQRYISIGRLMAALAETRELLAASEIGQGAEECDGSRL